MARRTIDRDDDVGLPGELQILVRKTDVQPRYGFIVKSVEHGEGAAGILFSDGTYGSLTEDECIAQWDWLLGDEAEETAELYTWPKPLRGAQPED
ncbi:MAG: hypothetical protein R3C68_18275 [Myxococcota bacterium]